MYIKYVFIEHLQRLREQSYHEQVCISSLRIQFCFMLITSSAEPAVKTTSEYR